MKLIKVALFTLFISQIAAAEIDVSLANGTEKEELKREQISRLIEQHDLKKWWFTDKIVIDESVRSPFSHPVLTLKATMPNNDNAGLSQLLHEQIHWFEGARSEFSTYLHLAVCLIELDALTHVLGKEKAEKVIATNGKYFYKWIYKTVLQDQTQIREVLKSNGLYI
jgi:hypothetical protein